MFDDDKNTRSKKIRIFLKTMPKKTSKKKKKIKKPIDWKNERNILEKYLSEEYSLGPKNG